MSKVHICRKHDLDEQQCKVVAEELLLKLIDKYGGRYAAEGENYVYKNAGVTALVEPKEGELVVDVKLGLMTRSFAPQLEKEMNRQLDKHFD